MGSMRAVMASIVVHAIVVTVLALAHEDAPPPPKPVEATPIAIVEVVPIDVVVIPDATNVVAPPSSGGVAPAPARGRGHARSAAATEGTGTGVGDGPVGPASGTSGGEGDGEAHKPLDLSMSGGVIAAILNKPAPPPIPHNPTEDGGTHLTVEADGTAHVDPHGGAETHMILPDSKKEWGDLVDEWAKDPEALTRKEGTIANEVAKTNIVPIFGGSFGAPDDRNRQKRLLESTFAQRADQRATHTAEQLAQTDQLMRRNLARLWRKVTDPVERRRELFALWDECEEGDGAAGEAGERARRQVIAWIRSHLPAGSTDAYSADEIRALDKHRDSTEHFAPYE